MEPSPGSQPLTQQAQGSPPLRARGSARSPRELGELHARAQTRASIMEELARQAVDSRLPSPEITAAQGRGEGWEPRLRLILSPAAHCCLQIAISNCSSDISFLTGTLAQHPWDGQN